MAITIRRIMLLPTILINHQHYVKWLASGSGFLRQRLQ
jgi:hypothetical protein